MSRIRPRTALAAAAITTLALGSTIAAQAATHPTHAQQQARQQRTARRLDTTSARASTAPELLIATPSDASSTPTASTPPPSWPSGTLTPDPGPLSSTPGAPDSDAADVLAGLPKIAWEGGAGYYSAFPAAAAAGWSDPKHFPIALWWGSVGSDSDIAHDKALGINTYVVLNPATDYQLLDRNHVSYIGTALANQPRTDPEWVGDFLDDEVDGRMSPAEGQNHLTALTSALPDHDKIRYANMTGMVISWLDDSHPQWKQAASTYVNSYTDAISLDAYWYSSPQCDWADPNGAAYLTAFIAKNCRDAQAYGRNVTSLRAQDGLDGKLQPVWNFIEDVDVAPDGAQVHALTPEEVKGAAISSLIHEARGLAWFNNSFGGPCASGNAIRSAQGDPNYACAATITAMGQVNNQIQALAPVLNTQSSVWNFGPGVETMLKGYQGAGYVFAMPTDAGELAGPGIKTFTLPDALKGKPITVIGEDRTITPTGDGTFTDTFASVNSYHIYKIG